MADYFYFTPPYNPRQELTIDVLPDDVLLTIFDFYVVGYQDPDFIVYHRSTKEVESWQSLVHVCRRWRGLVFGSPRRLNLQLFYIPGTSKSLDVWPALPLLIQGEVSDTSVDEDIAKLEHSDRICQITFRCRTTSQIEKLWTAMEVPFPELTVLYLSYHGPSYLPVLLPDSLLGGSASRLRFLALINVPFPGLPKLLSSASHLVELWFIDIPHSGYIPPEAMVTCLSTLTSLETLRLGFSFRLSSPDRETQHPHPPTRSVLPSLGSFRFDGVKKYLEELLARIDAPRLYQLSIQYVGSGFNTPDLNTPELHQFIGRTPTLGAYDEARLIFRSYEALFRLQSHTEPEPSLADRSRKVEVKILCRLSYQQLSSMAQFCSTISSRLDLLSTIENVYIYEHPYTASDWKDHIRDAAKWLDLFLPFTAVKNLYLSDQFAPRIAPALQELTGEGRTTEVLPALQSILVRGF